MSESTPEDDGAVDIFSNRQGFIDIEPEGKRPERNKLGKFDTSPNEEMQRKEVFAMATNASINFESTSQFFEFLEQSRAYLTTGALPGDAQPAPEAPEDTSGSGEGVEA